MIDETGRVVTILIDLCHCGHDRVTHHQGKHTCLGLRCDCRAFTHRDEPLPKPGAKRPAHHPSWCECYACKLAPPSDFVDIEESPITHPSWCTCPICLPQAHTASCTCAWCNKP